MLPTFSKVRIMLRIQDTGIILFHTNLVFFKVLFLGINIMLFLKNLQDFYASFSLNP